MLSLISHYCYRKTDFNDLIISISNSKNKMDAKMMRCGKQFHPSTFYYLVIYRWDRLIIYSAVPGKLSTGYVIKKNYNLRLRWNPSSNDSKNIYCSSKQYMGIYAYTLDEGGSKVAKRCKILCHEIIKSHYNKMASNTETEGQRDCVYSCLFMHSWGQMWSVVILHTLI